MGLPKDRRARRTAERSTASSSIKRTFSGAMAGVLAPSAAPGKPKGKSEGGRWVTEVGFIKAALPDYRVGKWGLAAQDSSRRFQKDTLRGTISSGPKGNCIRTTYAGETSMADSDLALS